MLASTVTLLIYIYGPSGSKGNICSQCCCRSSKFVEGRSLDCHTDTTFHILSSSVFTVSPHLAPYRLRYCPLLEWGLDDTQKVQNFFLIPKPSHQPCGPPNLPGFFPLIEPAEAFSQTLTSIFFCRRHPVMPQNWKTTINLFISYTTIFYLRYSLL